MCFMCPPGRDVPKTSVFNLTGLPMPCPNARRLPPPPPPPPAHPPGGASPAGTLPDARPAVRYSAFKALKARRAAAAAPEAGPQPEPGPGPEPEPEPEPGAEPGAGAEHAYEALQAALDHTDEVGIVKDLGAVLGDGATATQRRLGFALLDGRLAVTRATVGRAWAAGLRELRSGCDGSDASRARLHRATRAVLLANTDHYTAWNQRKRHLLLPGWQALDDELRLVDVLLSKHPKSGEAWTHRRWVLSRLGARTGAAGEIAALAAREFVVCASAARAYPKNYFAWTHRYWALTRLAPELASAECDAMRQWAAVNTSDHAGLHYRGSAVLLAAARAEQRQLRPPADVAAPSAVWHGDGGAAPAPWQQAWEQGAELQERYPGHEAMWRHRRLLAWVAHALRPPAVSMGDEVAFAEARQRTAEERAGAGSVGVREQRQWRSEALFAAQHARWAGMVGKVTGEA